MRDPVAPTTSASSLAALAFVLWACNPAGLDDLQNGQRRDAAAIDERGADAQRLDSAKAEVSTLRPDALPIDEPDFAGIVDAGQPIDGDVPDVAASVDLDLGPDGGAPVVDDVDAETDVAQSNDCDKAEAHWDVAEGSGGEMGSGGVAGHGGVMGSGGVAGHGGVAGSGGVAAQGGATAMPPDADLNPVDASTDTHEPPPKCGGVADSQICWYLGKPGESCATTCATRGGSSPQAASHVGNGSQGGSSQECSRLLSLLGMPGSVISASADEGVGCTVALGLHWYITSPPYSDSARLANVQIVCGCLR